VDDDVIKIPPYMMYLIWFSLSDLMSNK
jgi:hypothetical protein